MTNMAVSTSVNDAQDVVVCGLCDIKTKVNVRCMDCDLYLCDNCKERHSRFKHADSHSVLPIEDIHLHKDENLSQEFKPVKCKIHKAQFCSVFCKTCQCLICPICNVENHQKHELEKIEIMCKTKYDELKNLETEMIKRAQKFKENLHKIKSPKYAIIEKDLDAKIKVIQEVHTRHLQKLNDIKELTDPELISEAENNLLIVEKDISEASKEIEELLESKNTEMFLQAVDTLKEILKKNYKDFNPTGPKIELKSISGEFSPLISIFTDTRIELIRLGSLRMDGFPICSITSIQKDSVWIANYTEGQIQHLGLKNNIKIMETYKLPENQMTEIRCSDVNEILLTMSSKILRMKVHDGSFHFFKQISGSKINTLHVKTNGIVVAGMDMNDVDKRRDKPVIVIVDTTGRTISEYKDSGGQLLQYDVVRCCTALHGDDNDICYIDSQKNYPYYGRLVFLNGRGFIEWTYKGNPIINKKNHEFTPIEVLTTKNNNIVVLDGDQSALHVLKSTGFLLTILDLTLLGIREPRLMVMVSSRCLWLFGDLEGREKIFKLDISGL